MNQAGHGHGHGHSHAVYSRASQHVSSTEPGGLSIDHAEWRTEGGLTTGPSRQTKHGQGASQAACALPGGRRLSHLVVPLALFSRVRRTFGADTPTKPATVMPLDYVRSKRLDLIKNLEWLLRECM